VTAKSPSSKRSPNARGPPSNAPTPNNSCTRRTCSSRHNSARSSRRPGRPCGPPTPRPGHRRLTSWRHFTGQTYEEWVGWGRADAVHPDDRDYATRQWADAVRTGPHVETQFRLRDAPATAGTSPASAPSRRATPTAPSAASSARTPSSTVERLRNLCSLARRASARRAVAMSASTKEVTIMTTFETRSPTRATQPARPVRIADG
jgi:PAS fold